jgi:hypothetical protein
VKKLLRILLRGAAGLAVLIVMALFACLDDVDYRPYLKSPYYAEATARLKAIEATNTFARGELNG